jgi:hypothetical protein
MKELKEPLHIFIVGKQKDLRILRLTSFAPLRDIDEWAAISMPRNISAGVATEFCLTSSTWAASRVNLPTPSICVSNGRKIDLEHAAAMWLWVRGLPFDIRRFPDRLWQ